jgi:hypothetical protein
MVSLILLAGFQLHPFGPIRHCLPLAPGVLLLLAAGWTRLREAGHPWVADASLAALLGLALFGDATEISRWHGHDLKRLLATASREMNEGDGVVFSVMAGSVYRYYEPELPLETRPRMYCDAVKQARSGTTPDVAATRIANFDRLMELSLPDCRRVWFFSVHEDARPIESLLARHAHKARTIEGLNTKGSLWIRDEITTLARNPAPEAR